MGKLDGRVALVTGAGHGMGRAIAQSYAAEGAAVVLVDIDGPAVAASAEGIAATGARAEGLHGDVSNESDVAAAVAHTLSTYGRIDIACNDAGVMDGLTPLHHATLDDWNRVMATNATGVFLVCRAVIDPMLEAGAGAIVNIASIAGLQGGRAGACYTASKHAVVGLTRNIAFGYADRGVRCNAICPGAIRTNIAVRDKERDPEGIERAGKVMGSKPRSGQRTEIATVATFLASDEASYVNGAIIPVDGGWISA